MLAEPCAHINVSMHDWASAPYSVRPRERDRLYVKTYHLDKPQWIWEGIFKDTQLYYLLENTYTLP